MEKLSKHPDFIQFIGPYCGSQKPPDSRKSPKSKCTCVRNPPLCQARPADHLCICKSKAESIPGPNQEKDFWKNYFSLCRSISEHLCICSTPQRVSGSSYPDLHEYCLSELHECICHKRQIDRYSSETRKYICLSDTHGCICPINRERILFI